MRKPLHNNALLANLAVISAILFVFALGSCSNYPSDWPEIVRKNVFVPDAAKVSKAKAYRGMYGIKYILIETYPSYGYLSNMAKHMSELGWRRLEDDFILHKYKLNYSRGNNGEWDEYIDQKGDKIEGWIDDWEDNGRNIVRYNLKYHVGPNKDKSKLSSLEVVATYIPEKIRDNISSSFPSDQGVE